MVAENDGRKRMGENIGRAFSIGLLDDGSTEGTGGRVLPVYSIEAGGSGRAYVMAEESNTRGLINKAAEVGG